MSPVVICILVLPFLYTIAVFIDKVQLKGETTDANPGVLMALGSLCGLVVIVPMGLWIGFSGRGQTLTDLGSLIPLLFNEALYTFAMYIYLCVMKSEDASTVVPWFQTIPAFGLVGSFLVLGEKLGLVTIVAIFFLMIGGFLLSYQKGKINKKLLVLMVLSSVLIAVYDIIFAQFGRETDGFAAVFVNIVGKTFWSMVFLVSKDVRRGFMVGLKTRLKLQTVGELTTLIAELSMCVFLLYFPVAVVQGACCIVPLFVLGGAMILTKYRPQLVEEELSGLTLAQKTISITLMVIGGIILSV